LRAPFAVACTRKCQRSGASRAYSNAREVQKIACTTVNQQCTARVAQRRAAAGVSNRHAVVQNGAGRAVS